MMRPRRNPTSLKRHRKQSLITQHRVPHKSHEDLCPWSVTTTYHDYICAKDLEDKNNLLPRPTRTQPGLNNSTSCARSKWPSHSLLWWDQPQTGTTLGKHIELKCFLNEKNYGSESRGDQQDIPTPSSMDTKGRWQRRRSVPKLRSNFSRASSLNCATKPGRIYVMCTKGNTTRATSYMNIVLNFITKTNTPTLEYTHTWHYTDILKDWKIWDWTIPNWKIIVELKLEDVHACSIYSGVVKCNGWGCWLVSISMTEICVWCPWWPSLYINQFFAYFATCSSFVALWAHRRCFREIEGWLHLLHYLTLSPRCPLPSNLLAGWCPRKISDRHPKWWFKCLSTKLSLELRWRLPYIAIHRSIHPQSFLDHPAKHYHWEFVGQLS